ncbi:DUF3626 domain-containing protein [Nocardioides sp. LHG3406-4]|uniref:DUF3626 domain-containing protein n=1 Tax=Nocardioides sp. LHG3406-4 TaxID=2804575 RepID=UPI003CF0266B
MDGPRITVAFHPDWPFRGGLVLDALARDGVYLSQFATGSSNGGLTAHPGGDRWRWECRLFGGRYDTAASDARPVYGALDDRRDPYGASPRFGSAYLRLRPEVTGRTSFCFPDSVFEPDAVAGPERITDLVAMRDAAGHDALDDYVEAHVHGGLRLGMDVEALVLDPCFRGTAVSEAAERAGCPVEWHPGYSVLTAGLDDAYRGPEHVALARSLGEALTPDIIGSAARAGEHDPQALKKVWHLLARFGRRQDPDG